MAGRGRGKTLPAWMTRGNAIPAAGPAENQSQQVSGPTDLSRKADVIDNRAQNQGQGHGTQPVHGPPLLAGGQPNLGQFMPQPMTPTASAMQPVTHSNLIPANGASLGMPIQQTLPLQGNSATVQVQAPLQSAWSEHRAPDGRPYYYNRITKQSLWQKPEELKQAELAVSSQPSGSVKPTTPWKEFKAPDGRPYYFNSVTQQSTWTIPDEIRRIQEMEGKESKAGIANASESAPKHVVEAQTKSQEENKIAQSGGGSQTNGGEEKTLATGTAKATPLTFKTKEEAVRAFKDMLNELADTRMTWEKALKVIANDARYTALKSLGERKHVFHEWVTKKKKKQEEERRLEKKKAKEGFFDLLEAKSADGIINVRTRFKEADAALGSEERWNALEDPVEREELFEDFMDMLDKREKARLRAQREKNMAALKELVERQGTSACVSDWKTFEETFAEEECFKDLDKTDRIRVFDDCRREVLRKEEEEKQREREAARLRRRECRDAFRKLLMKLFEEGKIDRKSDWKDVKPAIRDSEEYVNLEEADKGRAHDLFEDYAEELDREHRDKRRTVKDVLRDNNAVMSPETTWEEFCSMLDSGEKSDATENARSENGLIQTGPLAQIKKRVLLNIYEDLIQKEKDKLRAEEKKRRAKKEDFLDLLERLHELEPTTPWDEARRLIEGRTAYKALREEERVTYYDEFIRQLTAPEHEGVHKRAREDEEQPEPGEIASANKSQRTE